MRKTYILFYSFFMILLVGCNSKSSTAQDSNTSIGNEITTIFSRTKSESNIISNENNTDKPTRNEVSNNTFSTRDDKVLDEIKSQLELIPKEYTLDNAIKDGCFVIINGKVKSKFKIMDKFVSDSHNGNPTSIIIVQSPTSGNTIITRIIYDGINYYGIEDATRYIDAYKSYHQFQFKYLKVFHENDKKLYYLINDKDITYAKLTKSLFSNNSNDWINHQIICYYNV